MGRAASRPLLVVNEHQRGEKMRRNTGADRVNFQEEERKYWEHWLKEGFGKRAEKIKQFVEQLYTAKEKQLPMKHYTPHGVDHCKAVEDNLHRLIPKECHEELSEAEKFFLIISAWIHDIGMLRGITSDDEQLSDDDIRDEHHKRSESYIVSHYAEIGIFEEESVAFGLLARFHRRRCNIEDCQYYLTIPKHGTVRLRLMAAYLRLADALHIDISRTPDRQYAISLAYSIPYTSKLHWYKSRFVHSVEVNVPDKNIIVYMKLPVEADEPQRGRELFHEKCNIIYNLIIHDLEEELASVKNVLFKENITYFLSIEKTIIEVEVDDRFRQDVKPVLNYYHLLDNPSSSALLTLVLSSIEGIISSGKKKPLKTKEGVSSSTKEQISLFIKEIETSILPTRKCHAGLSGLIDDIKYHLDKHGDTLENYIQAKKKHIDKNKKSIRWSAAKYLSTQMKNSSLFKENCVDRYIEMITMKVKQDKDDVDLGRSNEIYSEEQMINISKHISGVLSGAAQGIEKHVKILLRRIQNEHSNDEYDKKVKMRLKGLQGEENQDDAHDEAVFFKEKINILLYGYSDLVMETLCGFRDAVTKEFISLYQNYTDTGTCKADVDLVFYQHDNIRELKKMASECFCIFCCEGQPKNHTTWSGRFHHHDGSRYALALAEKGFKEIYIIPDAAAASLFSIAAYRRSDHDGEKFPSIQFIITGTNGFNNDTFKHSAGHSMLVSVHLLAKMLNEEKEGRKNVPIPKLILSTMTDKFTEQSEDDHEGNVEQKKSKKFLKIGGWSFRSSFSKELVRNHSFFTQDPELQKSLDEHKDAIHLYNPREDNISINFVDVVISEKCFLEREKIGDGEKKTWTGKQIRDAKDDSTSSNEADNTN